MNPARLAVIIVVLVFLGTGIALLFTYNNLVGLDQRVKGQWAQVETQYQRRIDLKPRLVSTVQGYTQFEKDLLTNITSLRSQWASSATIEDRIKYGSALDSALGRLLLVYENYPDLQTITAVQGLMDELAGTENRIAVERMLYNDAVRSYNTAVNTVPTVLVANTFGFTDKLYYQSTAAA